MNPSAQTGNAAGPLAAFGAFLGLGAAWQWIVPLLLAAMAG